MFYSQYLWRSVPARDIVTLSLACFSPLLEFLFFFLDPQSRREISFSTSSWGVCEWIHLKCYLGFPSLLVPRKLPLFAGTFVSVTYFYKMYVSGVFYVDIITHVLYSLQATYMCRFIVKSCWISDSYFSERGRCNSLKVIVDFICSLYFLGVFVKLEKNAMTKFWRFLQWLLSNYS